MQQFLPRLACPILCACLAACASSDATRAPAAQPLAQAEHASPFVHAALVLEVGSAEAASALAAAFDSATADWKATSPARGGSERHELQGGALALDLLAPPAALESALELAADAVQRALGTPQADSAASAGFDSLRDRDAALGTTWTPPAARLRWRAAALAQPADSAVVARAFGELEARLAKLGSREPPQPATRLPGVFVVDSAASAPSELRWVPATELAEQFPPAERARGCVRAALLARRAAGWTFVPASLDALGRREPAYLYASGDVAHAKAALAALRAALAEPVALDAAQAERLQRVAFAKAQLEQESFRLHALLGARLPGFQGEHAALAQLGAEQLTAPLDPAGSRWSAVGPAPVWTAELAPLGAVVVLESRGFADRDAAAEAALARMWSALGGAERWRELKTLRTLGSLSGATGRQGIEQWSDLEGHRFAISQAIGAQETVLVATAAEVWTVDAGAGVDLAPAQAHKLRARYERSIFALLHELASEAHATLSVQSEGERLAIGDKSGTRCWLALDAAGLPHELGYTLDGAPEESRYEFQDWKLDAPLPYPERTLQLDRGATYELQHVEPNAKLDPLLWVRGKR